MNMHIYLACNRNEKHRPIVCVSRQDAIRTIKHRSDNKEVFRRTKSIFTSRENGQDVRWEVFPVAVSHFREQFRAIEDEGDIRGRYLFFTADRTFTHRLHIVSVFADACDSIDFLLSHIQEGSFFDRDDLEYNFAHIERESVSWIIYPIPVSHIRQALRRLEDEDEEDL